MRLNIETETTGAKCIECAHKVVPDTELIADVFGLTPYCSFKQQCTKTDRIMRFSIDNLSEV